MKERSPQLHDVGRYNRNEAILYGLRNLGRTGCAALAFTFGAYTLDLGYTLITEPDRNSQMEWSGTKNCKNATFVAVHLGSTGKDIAQWQADNNQAAIENAGGAILVTKYDTKGDIGEFRDHLDETLAACARPDRPYVPVVFNGVSLGGKYAQWITNARLKNGIPIGIIMESSPTGIDSIRDTNVRALMSVANPDRPIPMTKGMVFGNSLMTEISRRGMGIFANPYSVHDIVSSTQQTNAKTLTWQIVANSQPWPIAVQPGDNNVPIDYIYTDGDTAVNTALVRLQLKLFTHAEVTEHLIPPEKSWDTAPNHADGWRQDATNAADYRSTYASIYRKYGERVENQRQEIAKEYPAPRGNKRIS